MVLSNATVSIFNPNDLPLLQLGKDPIQHAALRPMAHACIDRMLIPKLLREGATVAALLGDIQDCVEHLQMVERDVDLHKIPHWRDSQNTICSYSYN